MSSTRPSSRSLRMTMNDAIRVHVHPCSGLRPAPGGVPDHLPEIVVALVGALRVGRAAIPRLVGEPVGVALVPVPGRALLTSGLARLELRRTGDVLALLGALDPDRVLVRRAAGTA